MGFFDPPPPRPQPEPWEWREPREWEPPSNMLGQPVAVKAVLVRTEEIAISVVGVAAFPTGIRFKVLGLGRPRPWRAQSSARSFPSPFHRPGQDVDEELRFGVLLSDGSKVTNQDERPWPGETDPERQPQGPVLLELGGSGSDRTWSESYWLWPLPPAGDLTFVCEWPSLGIPESRASVEAAPIREAATQAITLWPVGVDAG